MQELVGQEIFYDFKIGAVIDLTPADGHSVHRPGVHPEARG
jgi:hypothetical protein